MKTQRLLIVLTFANLALLIFLFTQLPPAVVAREATPVLRGRALEIVDARGEVRASITVHPANTRKGGEHYPETVLLRLITERGRPSVKISASEQLTGLAFAGPTGTKETSVQLGAQGTDSSLKLRNENGRAYLVTP